MEKTVSNLRRMILAAFAIAALLAGIAPGRLRAQTDLADAHEGFVSLFNGKDLKGWKGDPKLWKVKDGVVIGSTVGNKISKNQFLISEAKFSNFVLRASVKLHNHNSGIQFRSEEMPEFVAAGYQADAADGYWGMVYEERKRGILDYWKKMSDADKKKIADAIKPGDWNEYEITADGAHLKLVVNGVTASDFRDPAGAKEGILALQLHAGPDMTVEFKNVRIKELEK